MSPLGLLAPSCCSAESLFVLCFFPSSSLEENYFISCWRKWRPLFIPSPEQRGVKHRCGLMPLKFLCPHAHISMSAPSPGVLGFLRGISAQRVENWGWIVEKAQLAAQADSSALRSRTCCFCQQKEPRCFSIYTGELAEGRLALSCCTFGKDPFFSKSLA